MVPDIYAVVRSRNVERERGFSLWSLVGLVLGEQLVKIIIIKSELNNNNSCLKNKIRL